MYKIHKVIEHRIPVYELITLDTSEPIKGKFYESEMVLVRGYYEKLHKVQEVIKERKRNGKVEVLIRWVGHSAEHDSWILKDLLKNA